MGPRMFEDRKLHYPCEGRRPQKHSDAKKEDEEKWHLPFPPKNGEEGKGQWKDADVEHVWKGILRKWKWDNPAHDLDEKGREGKFCLGALGEIVEPGGEILDKGK